MSGAAEQANRHTSHRCCNCCVATICCSAGNLHKTKAHATKDKYQHHLLSFGKKKNLYETLKLKKTSFKINSISDFFHFSVFADVVANTATVTLTNATTATMAANVMYTVFHCDRLTLKKKYKIGIYSYS